MRHIQPCVHSLEKKKMTTYYFSYTISSEKKYFGCAKNKKWNWIAQEEKRKAWTNSGKQLTSQVKSKYTSFIIRRHHHQNIQRNVWVNSKETTKAKYWKKNVFSPDWLVCEWLWLDLWLFFFSEIPIQRCNMCLFKWRVKSDWRL